MSKIISLIVSNLLRLKAVEIKPDGSPLVIVGGKNDQGKSSLLNCIGIALSGKDLPAKPIRDGAAKGHVILETEEIIVTKTFSQTGGSTLEVRDRDGQKLTSPQAKLDALVSKVTFDPLAFTRMDAAKQLATLKQIVGLDFTDLDAERAAKYLSRTEIGRQKKAQEGKLAAIKRTADVPANEISVADLSRELQLANETNQGNAAARESLSDCNDGVATAEQQATHAAVRVGEAEAALERARAELEAAKAQVTREEERREVVRAEVEKLQDVPTEPILRRMETCEQTNVAIRDNARWSEEHKALLTLNGQYDDLTTRIEEIDRTKEEKMGEAEFPVDGLGFSDTGVTFNGHPFGQSSSSVQIRTSLAIACSLNPKLNVMLIRDGSLLDEDSLKLVADYAEKHGSQVWCEIVGDREDATVIIEDGTVIAEPIKTAKKKK
jgi:hypothetical protein